MGCEGEETEQNRAVPKLPLFSVPSMESPERPGTLTPPIYSPASVPFRWEKEPGKPRFTAADVSRAAEFAGKSLELPPRLLLMEAYNGKLQSPTTVFDGPYSFRRPRFQSSSFRMMSKECYGSFSSERVEIGTSFMRKKWEQERGWLSSWRKRVLRGKREVGVGGLVFPSSLETESFNSKTKFIRNGSFSSLSQARRPHFWASVCEGLKQVVPWRSKKVKREA